MPVVLPQKECVNHIILENSTLVFVLRVRHSDLCQSLVSRDRLVVRTLRCGRSNPGSNPGHGMQEQLFSIEFVVCITKNKGSTGI